MPQRFVLFVFSSPWIELSMSAKALMVVAVICLAEALLAGSRSLARGGGGFHGGGISAGHGGQMDGFSMHGPAMGRHPRGADERDKYGHRDDRRDQFEHRHDHRYAHRDDHQWHRDYGFGDRGHDGPHPEGTWSSSSRLRRQGTRRTTSGRDLESSFRLRRQLPRPDNRQWSVARWKLKALGRGGPM